MTLSCLMHLGLVKRENGKFVCGPQRCTALHLGGDCGTHFRSYEALAFTCKQWPLLLRAQVVLH